MALAWLDGFETYNTQDGDALEAEMLAYGYHIANMQSGATSNGTLVAGAIHGKALQWQRTSNDPFLRLPVSCASTVILGCAIRHQGFTQDTNYRRLFSFLHPNANRQFTVHMLPSGQLWVARDFWTETLALAPALSAATWSYLEIKYKVSNSEGSVEIRVNGQTVAAETGLDTQAQNTSWIGVIDFYPAIYTSLDDIYVCDDTDADPSFLGPLSVESLSPSSDVTADWSPSTPGSHYELVDERPADDGDYIQSGTAGHTDLFGVTPLQHLDTDIKAVRQFARAKTMASGKRILQLACKSGVTTVTADESLCGTSFGPLQRFLEADPDTGTGWTASGVNAAQFGVKVGD